MRRALLTAGAVLILSAPAFADEVTIEKKTITKTVPESGSTMSTEIIAPTPPPPVQVEVPPPPPAPGVAWVPGHWRWSPEAQRYVWLRGKFIEPPREHAEWVPGRFVERPDGWVWKEGRWD
jgi:hypothetical protein